MRQSRTGAKFSGVYRESTWSSQRLEGRGKAFETYIKIRNATEKAL